MNIAKNLRVPWKFDPEDEGTVILETSLTVNQSTLRISRKTRILNETAVTASDLSRNF